MNESKLIPCTKCGTPMPSAPAKTVCALCALADAQNSGTHDAKSAKLDLHDVPLPKSEIGRFGEYEGGDQVGRYKIREKIGEGGCGVVYLAEQEEPVRRRVALKVIKLGMDTRSVVARFEAERQALALMDHPNIAKVFDGGSTETGRPFFVMELVRGVRITDYCDQNNLSTEQRLELFILVCQAIQHAHQKGIIHRDIKPSNILVTLIDGVPVPKVIDFGIAKAITNQSLGDKTVYTAMEQFLGTPTYMSPEQAQANGLDIDTRCDVYALGVLLYELLTGKTPFDTASLLQAGFDKMRSIIREDEPPRPSTRLSTLADDELAAVASRRRAAAPRLIRLIRGDLDWIVIKALEKDRTRRYDTVTGLAGDVKRHLENEAVSARPPSPLYRLQKTVQRNQAAFITAGAVAFLLVFGLGLVTWLFLREREAKKQVVAAQLAETHLRAQNREMLAYPGFALTFRSLYFKQDLTLGGGSNAFQTLVKNAREDKSDDEMAWAEFWWLISLTAKTNWNEAAIHGRKLLVLAETPPEKQVPLWAAQILLGSVLCASGTNQEGEFLLLSGCKESDQFVKSNNVSDLLWLGCRTMAFQALNVYYIDQNRRSEAAVWAAKNEEILRQIGEDAPQSAPPSATPDQPGKNLLKNGDFTARPVFQTDVGLGGSKSISLNPTNPGWADGISGIEGWHYALPNLNNSASDHGIAYSTAFGESQGQRMIFINNWNRMLSQTVTPLTTAGSMVTAEINFGTAGSDSDAGRAGTFYLVAGEADPADPDKFSARSLILQKVTVGNPSFVHLPLNKTVANGVLTNLTLNYQFTNNDPALSLPLSIAFRTEDQSVGPTYWSHANLTVLSTSSEFADVAFEDFPDTRPGKHYATNELHALKYDGMQTLHNCGDITTIGPVFFSETHYPYLQLVTNHSWILLQPGNDKAASLAISVKHSGEYRITGAFARAHTAQYNGNGVCVAIIRDRDTTNLLFSSTISSAPQVNVQNPFQGEGLIPFDRTLALKDGEVLRFMVFERVVGTLDLICDETALDFTLVRMGETNESAKKFSTTNLLSIIP